MHIAVLLLFLIASPLAWADSTSEASKEFELFTAASKGQNERIRQLIQDGADVNGRYYAETALIGAIRSGKESTVKLVLETGANPNLPDAQGSPLILAVAYVGNPEIVAALLKSGADPNFVYERDRQGWAPLAYLAWVARYSNAQQIEVARLLLSAGAFVDKEGADGSTPLRNAIKQNKVELAKVILQRGADPNKITEMKFVDFESGEVPLHSAIAQYRISKNVSMVRLLLDFGANPNHRNDRVYVEGQRGHDAMWSGTSPLLLAAEMGYVPIVRLLLERGAKSCLARTDGILPYELALKAGHPLTAKILRQHLKTQAC